MSNSGMKNKIAMLLVAVSVMLTGCSRYDASQLPAGTWVYECAYPNGDHIKSKTVVASDGRYVCYIALTGTNNLSKTYELEGSLEIKDGFLIDTMTKSSQTNAPIPHTSRAQIIRRSESELVTKWEGAETESIIRKVK